MTKLSVVIVAKNEERTIDDVLSAVKPIADEIVFVDSGSNDATVEIAKSHGVNFYDQDWLGYAAQKNYAVSLATGDWILSLDADEVLTPQVVAEIGETLQGANLDDYNGFTIPRILYIGNRAVKGGGFYPDAQLRLFRKGKGEFNDRLVHERVFVDGKVGALKNPMKHFAYDNVESFAEAMDKYAHLSAQEAKKSGYSAWKVSPVNELFHPLWTFLFRYVIRGGLADGWLGLQLNLIYSDYVRKKITYLRQLERGSP